MSEYVEITFGKYKGKSLEQIAVSDYPYFKWLKGIILSDRIRESIEELEYKLNHYVPQLSCAASGCSKTAEFMSVVATRFGVSVGPAYVGCAEHIEQIRSMHPKAIYYPIKYDSLLQIFSGKPTRADLQELLDFLLLTTGWERKRRRTKRAMKEHFDNLKLMGEQLRLF